MGLLLDRNSLKVDFHRSSSSIINYLFFLQICALSARNVLGSMGFCPTLAIALSLRLVVGL
jgi:hypothetical protein